MEGGQVLDLSSLGHNLLPNTSLTPEQMHCVTGDHNSVPIKDVQEYEGGKSCRISMFTNVSDGNAANSEQNQSCHPISENQYPGPSLLDLAAAACQLEPIETQTPTNSASSYLKSSLCVLKSEPNETSPSKYTEATSKGYTTIDHGYSLQNHAQGASNPPNQVGSNLQVTSGTRSININGITPTVYEQANQSNESDDEITIIGETKGKHMPLMFDQESFNENITDVCSGSALALAFKHIQSVYTCSACSISLPKRQQIEKHVNERHWHAYQEGPYVCKECLVMSSDSREFKRHVKQCHRTFHPGKLLPKKILQMIYSKLIIPPSKPTEHKTRTIQGRHMHSKLVPTRRMSTETQTDPNICAEKSECEMDDIQKQASSMAQNGSAITPSPLISNSQSNTFTSPDLNLNFSKPPSQSGSKAPDQAPLSQLQLTQLTANQTRETSNAQILQNPNRYENPPVLSRSRSKSGPAIVCHTENPNQQHHTLVPQTKIPVRPHSHPCTKANEVPNEAENLHSPIPGSCAASVDMQRDIHDQSHKQNRQEMQQNFISFCEKNNVPGGVPCVQNEGHSNVQDDLICSSSDQLSSKTSQFQNSISINTSACMANVVSSSASSSTIPPPGSTDASRTQHFDNQERGDESIENKQNKFSNLSPPSCTFQTQAYRQRHLFNIRHMKNTKENSKTIKALLSKPPMYSLLTQQMKTPQIAQSISRSYVVVHTDKHFTSDQTVVPLQTVCTTNPNYAVQDQESNKQKSIQCSGNALSGSFAGKDVNQEAPVIGDRLLSSELLDPSKGTDEDQHVLGVTNVHSPINGDKHQSVFMKNIQCTMNTPVDTAVREECPNDPREIINTDRTSDTNTENSDCTVRVLGTLDTIDLKPQLNPLYQERGVEHMKLQDSDNHQDIFKRSCETRSTGNKTKAKTLARARQSTNQKKWGKWSRFQSIRKKHLLAQRNASSDKYQTDSICTIAKTIRPPPLILNGTGTSHQSSEQFSEREDNTKTYSNENEQGRKEQNTEQSTLPPPDQLPTKPTGIEESDCKAHNQETELHEEDDSGCEVDRQISSEICQTSPSEICDDKLPILFIAEHPDTKNDRDDHRMEENLSIMDPMQPEKKDICQYGNLRHTEVMLDSKEDRLLHVTSKIIESKSNFGSFGVIENDSLLHVDSSQSLLQDTINKSNDMEKINDAESCAGGNASPTHSMAVENTVDSDQNVLGSPTIAYISSPDYLPDLENFELNEKGRTQSDSLEEVSSIARRVFQSCPSDMQQKVMDSLSTDKYKPIWSSDEEVGMESEDTSIESEEAGATEAAVIVKTESVSRRTKNFKKISVHKLPPNATASLTASDIRKNKNRQRRSVSDGDEQEERVAKKACLSLKEVISLSGDAQFFLQEWRRPKRITRRVERDVASKECPLSPKQSNGAQTEKQVICSQENKTGSEPENANGSVTNKNGLHSCTQTCGTSERALGISEDANTYERITNTLFQTVESVGSVANHLSLIFDGDNEVLHPGTINNDIEPNKHCDEDNDPKLRPNTFSMGDSDISSNFDKESKDNSSSEQNESQIKDNPENVPDPLACVTLQNDSMSMTKTKTWQCFLCDVQEQSINAMRQHCRKHVKLYPFSCSACEHKAHTEIGIQDHIERHHGSKGEFSKNQKDYKLQEKLVNMHLGEINDEFLSRQKKYNSYLRQKCTKFITPAPLDSNNTLCTDAYNEGIDIEHPEPGTKTKRGLSHSSWDALESIISESSVNFKKPKRSEEHQKELKNFNAEVSKMGEKGIIRKLSRLLQSPKYETKKTNLVSANGIAYSSLSTHVESTNKKTPCCHQKSKTKLQKVMKSKKQTSEVVKGTEKSPPEAMGIMSTKKSLNGKTNGYKKINSKNQSLLSTLAWVNGRKAILGTVEESVRNDPKLNMIAVVPLEQFLSNTV